MSKKVIYYSDELHDDFAGTDVDTCTIPDDFTFVNKNPLWRFAEAVLYRGIATPLVWLIAKIGFGFRLKNKKAIKGLRKEGFFLFGNHTQTMMDAYTPSLCVFPHKAHIIVGPDAVSIKGIRQIVLMLGAIPLPSGVKGYRPFREALRTRIEQNRVVTVYPEAHIWPWYTGIRPFPPTSFSYPVEQNRPCVAFVTTYRRRKLFPNMYPKITVTLSEPFYPDTSLPPKEARQKIRDEVYGFMCRTAADTDNYAHITYIKNE